jgi:iron complex outermembrane receptor protein
MQSLVRLLSLATALLALELATWPVPAVQAQETGEELVAEGATELVEAELEDEAALEGQAQADLQEPPEADETAVEIEAELEDLEGEEEADEPESWAGIEEITVTANKREQALQDVPISMSVLQSDFIENAAITEFGQLQQFVPNLKINTGPNTRATVVRIRGIGSVGDNAGIDPSVGVFIDGVYQGRAGMSVADLLDIERVEVLRGPQGTLYGKNTAAGAINIHTKRPIYDFESMAEVVVGNYHDMEFRGFINVPLWQDRIGARISGYRVTRDGFDTNRFDGSDVNDANKWGVRGRFLFDVTPNLEVLVGADYSYEHTNCCVADIMTYKGPSALSAIGLGLNTTDITWLGENPEWQPNVQPDYRNPPLSPESWQEVWDRIGQPAPPYPYEQEWQSYEEHAENLDEKYDADPFDRVVGANDDPDNKITIGGVSVNAELALGDFTASSLSAYRHYTSDNNWDGDFTAIINASATSAQVDLDQFSQEFQIISPSGEQVEYQGGLYFYFQNMDTFERMGIEEEEEGIYNYNWLRGVYNDNTNLHRTYSLAGYGQGTYNLSDEWSFTGGMRLSWERKTRVGSQIAPNSPLTPDPDDGDDVVDAPPVSGPDQFFDQEKDWFNVSGMASIRYFPVERVMIYGTYSLGFKSGGFNQRRTSETERLIRDNTMFGPETANTVEAGAKTSWWDRRLTLNGTFFYTWYSDFQAQVYDGATISVVNAGSMRSYGVEADLSLVPVPDLVISGSLGWNVAEYKFYPEAEDTVEGAYPCWQYNAALGQNPPPELVMSCTQDLSGKTVDNAPRWTVKGFAQYERPVPVSGFSVLWNAQAEYAYTSMMYLAPDLDPALKQPATHLLNLRAGLRAEDELWTLTLWVENVTDEKWNVIGFDAPIIGGYAVINGPPRRFGATLRLKF